jgi:hypothetical protein
LTQMHPLDADKDHMLPKYNNPGIEGFEAGLNEVGICLSDRSSACMYLFSFVRSNNGHVRWHSSMFISVFFNISFVQ